MKVIRLYSRVPVRNVSSGFSGNGASHRCTAQRRRDLVVDRNNQLSPALPEKVFRPQKVQSQTRVDAAYESANMQRPRDLRVDLRT